VLYHWLSSEREKQLGAFEDRLAANEDPAAAWAAAFPELDPAKPDALARLDRELAAYRGNAHYEPFRVRPRKVDASFQERALSPAELHLMRVAVRDPSRWPKAGADRAALVRAEYDEALREDPTLPDAVAARAREDGRSIAAALTPVTVARPADARGWFLLASALDPAVDPGEKELSLRRAVALAPDDAVVNAELARLLASAGRAKEARPFAERALELAPWDRQAVETLGDVAFRIDQCKPAIALERRAADLLSPGDPALDAIRSRIAAYETSCGGAAGAAAKTAP
jgi:tetratricopeptide (TPR) repeat protein